MFSELHFFEFLRGKILEISVAHEIRDGGPEARRAIGKFLKCFQK
jgi:hypothetical protein